MPLADAASFPLWLNGGIFTAAAIAVWILGRRLTLAVDAIADRTRLDHAFAGMLLLGGLTSLPELANVITSASIGNPELGINNLLGSAAINVLLLAVADAFIGRDAVTGIVARPSVLMMGVLCILVLLLIAGAILLGEAKLFGAGAGSVTICAASLAAFWIATGYDRRSPWSVAGAEERKADSRGERSVKPLASLWTVVAICGTLIFVAGYSLSQTGDAIARQTGLGSALVGFVLIGIATSMPELSTIVAALRIGRPEMAFGQVFGTNFINLALILVADLAYSGGPVLGRLGRFESLSALLGAALIGLFMVGLLEHRDRTIYRMGHDSAAVILLFGVGLALIAKFAG